MLEPLSRIARGVLFTTVLTAPVACGSSEGVSGMSGEQSPAKPAASPAAPAPQAQQPPSTDRCAEGLFQTFSGGNVAPSSDAATVRERVVSFDVNAVMGMPARLDLNLFDDMCVVAVRQPDAPSSPVPVWNGSVDGVPGSQVIIVFNQGTAAGSIVMPPRAFNLDLVRDGIYRIREVDVTKYPNEKPPLSPPPPPLPKKQP